MAAALAVFLLYTSIAGGGTPSLRPSTLQGHTGKVAIVPVVYKGSVPDLFRAGRDIVVEGRLVNGVFVAVPGTLVTKCPSKYTPKQS